MLQDEGDRKSCQRFALVGLCVVCEWYVVCNYMVVKGNAGWLEG